jgi:hypothetical protein
MKTISTKRGEAWVALQKLADKLKAAGDVDGEEVVRDAAIALGKLKNKTQ